MRTDADSGDPYSPLCERLEGRALLSGVTIVTHGWQFDSAEVPWVDAIRDDIGQRMAASVGAVTRFDIEVTQGDLGLSVQPKGFIGLPASATPSGEVVIGLIWTAVAGSTDPFTTQDVAAAVAGKLLDATFAPALGLNMPLAALPIHLIGHSRGGSLVTALARELGQSGVWVDQVTMLDPHPLSFTFHPDEAPAIYENVVFADDYWQSLDILWPTGTPVTGAMNRHLTSLAGGNFHDHYDVHLWYSGTVDVNAQDPEASGTLLTDTMRESWYSAAEQRGTVAGFYWSRVGGGLNQRSPSWRGTSFGGSQPRIQLNRVGVQWADVGGIEPSTLVASTGQVFQIAFSHQNPSASAQVEFFLDTDTNPLTSGPAPVIGSSNVLATSQVIAGTASCRISGVLAGTYFVGARIRDAQHTRYAYASSALHVTAGSSPAEQFIQRFLQSAQAGVVDGDAIATNLNATVGQVASSTAYWGATNHWFQDSLGDVWSLWNGGPVHLSSNLPGQHVWILTNLTDAAGLSGSMHFAPGSLSGITTGWNAFNIQGIQDGKLTALWWSPAGSAGTYVDTDGSFKQGGGWGARGNGWSLSSISDAAIAIGGAIAAPPAAFLAYSESQGNGRTEFDPRRTRFSSNLGMSVVVVDTNHRVFAVTFSVSQRAIAGALPAFNRQWVLEPLPGVPSLADYGLISQIVSIEQEYVAAATS